MKSFLLLIGMVISTFVFANEVYTSADFHSGPEKEPRKPKKMLYSPSIETEKDHEGERISKIKSFEMANPKFKKFIKPAINKELAIGMPYSLVVLSHGKPLREKETVTASGKTQSLSYATVFISLQNGLVDSWESYK